MANRIDQLELRITQLIDTITSLKSEMLELRQIVATVVDQRWNTTRNRVDNIDDFKLEAAIIAAAKPGEGTMKLPYQCCDVVGDM